MQLLTQSDLIPALEKALKQPLPGLESQLLMAHDIRKLTQNTRYIAPEKARIAAVLILLYPHQEQWHTVLMLRTESKYAHSRQVSFPGGRQEKNDPTFEAIALREAKEEVGIPSQEVRVLGQLTEIYIPVSGNLVYPFVGTMDSRPNFVGDPSEVAEIMEVPLSLFLQPEMVKKIDLQATPDLILKDTPYYDVFGQVVWGATAMMLSELTTIIRGLPTLSNTH